MNKINNAKCDSRKSAKKLLAPPKKIFIRKLTKVKEKTEMGKTKTNFTKIRNEKKSKTFKPFKSKNLDLIDSPNININSSFT